MADAEADGFVLGAGGAQQKGHHGVEQGQVGHGILLVAHHHLDGKVDGPVHACLALEYTLTCFFFFFFFFFLGGGGRRSRRNKRKKKKETTDN